MQPETLLAFFDSIAPQYPYGIPRQTTHSGARIIFLHDRGENLPDAEKALLEAAITKGLKLPLAAVQVLPIEALESDGALSAARGGATLVLLGRQCAAKAGIKEWSNATWTKTGSGTQALMTLALQEVIASENVKREFWRALKLLQELPL